MARFDDTEALRPTSLEQHDVRLAPFPLRAAIDWLCRSHDATGRQGSSKGYSLLRGWLPAYPETSGYLIGTLLANAELSGRTELVDRAVELGRWEERIQLPDGGVMEGTVAARRRRSIVFNTGMVLHGWIDLLHAGHSEFLDSAARAVRLLVDKQYTDGTWDISVEYCGIPHTYNARVAWALLRWDALADDSAARTTAIRHLDWVLSRQTATGWFRDCTFRQRSFPSTHALAYTMRGLLEAAEMTGRREYLEAARRAADEIIDAMLPSRSIPATFSESWEPKARYECLTGTAQVGGVCLRLYEMTREARYLSAGARAVSHATSHQVRAGSPRRFGALPGSNPIWGRYAPMQYPNWAAKFLADALMLYDRLDTEA